MPAREELLSKNTRSPGRASARLATAVPAVACWLDVRGMVMPTSANTRWVNPEQSRPFVGSVPPQR
ncbi:unannotated protein [freshwater metagenome]|uniref:Unannotated protein n=1 Tax=freshwater metagenome TaxID=449393 RepID=A0A6J7IDH0_9ZZZZ